MLLRFENECISIFYNITWAPRTNFFQGQELFFSILITKKAKNEIRDNKEKECIWFTDKVAHKTDFTAFGLQRDYAQA